MTLPVTVEHTSIFECAKNKLIIIVIMKKIIGLGTGCGMPEATKWGACGGGARAQVPPRSQASSKAVLHLPRLSARTEAIRWAREEENRPADRSD